jgi:hypothetical protein
VWFLVGSHVDPDTKIFALTEVHVLRRNPNISPESKNILEYYVRCIQSWTLRSRVAQRVLWDRVGFDDLQASKFLPSTYWMPSGKAQAKTTPPVPVTTYWRLSSS